MKGSPCWSSVPILNKDTPSLLVSSCNQRNEVEHVFFMCPNFFDVPFLIAAMHAEESLKMQHFTAPRSVSTVASKANMRQRQSLSALISASAVDNEICP